MLHGKKIVVVMPAYRAEKTLEACYPRHSARHRRPRAAGRRCERRRDARRRAAARHRRPSAIRINLGYGANQKTCYAEALRAGADIVVMLHPDYQYEPRLITAMASHGRLRRVRRGARLAHARQDRARRRHAALQVRREPRPDRAPEPAGRHASCPNTTPAFARSRGACSRRCRSAPTRPTSCSTTRCSCRRSRSACASARSRARRATSRTRARSASGALARLRPRRAADERAVPAVALGPRVAAHLLRPRPSWALAPAARAPSAGAMTPPGAVARPRRERRRVARPARCRDPRRRARCARTSSAARSSSTTSGTRCTSCCAPTLLGIAHASRLRRLQHSADALLPLAAATRSAHRMGHACADAARRHRAARRRAAAAARASIALPVARDVGGAARDLAAARLPQPDRAAVRADGAARDARDRRVRALVARRRQRDAGRRPMSRRRSSAAGCT